jgi:hypothetical protein
VFVTYRRQPHRAVAKSVLMNKVSTIAVNVFCLASILFSQGGCHLDFFPKPPADIVEEPVPVEPGKKFYRLPPYLFLADFDIDPKLPIFRELTGLRNQLASELHVPSTQQMIRVYLFENRTKYEQYLDNKHPNLPRRRAFFVAMPRSLGGTEELIVYTFWGDRIQQDLRHELTHALLHSTLIDVPLWLDEGLAEYFENPQGWSGINYKHLDHLQRQDKHPFQPNMQRLEMLREINDMTMADYREAWAWVHFMLRGHPKAKQVLLGYLQELRSNRKPGPLLPRLQAAVPDLETALLNHLKQLDGTRPGQMAGSR